MRIGEAHFAGCILQEQDSTGNRLMPVADLAGGDKFGLRRRDDPAEVSCLQTFCKDVLLLAHDHPVLFSVNRHDIQRFAPGDTQTLPLPDRVAVRAPVVPQQRPVQVHNLTPRISQDTTPFQKSDIIIARDEADLLAVALFSHRQSEFPGQTAHLVLAPDLAQGEEQDG